MNSKEEIHVLHETIDYLTQKLYGRSSEKTATIIDGQLSLFDEIEIFVDENATEPNLKEVQGYRRKKFKGQRAELLKDLPRKKGYVHLLKKTNFVKFVVMFWFQLVKNLFVLKFNSFLQKSK